MRVHALRSPVRPCRGRPGRRFSRSGLLLAALVAMLGTGPTTAPAGPLARLQSDRASPGERRAAARELLAAPDREPVRPRIAEILRSGQQPAAARAIARTIARLPAPPRELRAPLLEGLRHAHGETARALAAALGAYAGEDTTAALVRRLGATRAPIRARANAARALGHRRSRRAAEALVSALAPSAPDAVRDSAREALANLTGLAGSEDSATFWHAWWREHRDLTPAEWGRELLGNWTRRARRLAERARRLRERLVASERRRYRILDPAKRTARIAELLSDPLRSLRQLGVSLAEQRLLDNEAIPEAVRSALIDRLADAAPEIQRQAALLMRDLGDPRAARRVAELLADGEIRDNRVRRAFLLMMASVPRRDAVPAAIAALRTPGTSEAAAEALSAAARKGMLPPARVPDVRRQVRRELERQTVPTPAAIRLLGRVARPADWTRIRDWLDHPNGDVRIAATRAWIEAEKTLAPLAERADEPRTAPLVVAAARRRGAGPATLLALARHFPGPHDDRDAWEAALRTVVARSAWPDVVRAIQALGASETELRANLLRHRLRVTERWLAERLDSCRRLLGEAENTRLIGVIERAWRAEVGPTAAPAGAGRPTTR